MCAINPSTFAISAAVSISFEGFLIFWWVCILIKSLTDKPEESVDNPFNNPIDGSINASNQLNNDQLYDSEQPNDYDLDENNFNDQKKNHEKGHKGISGFKKVLLYGLGIVLLGGGAVGGWYLNNIYNHVKNLDLLK